MSGSDFIPLVYQIKNLVFRRNKLFHQALDLHFLIFILQQFELLVVVQQVENFAAVNLIHSNCHSEISLVTLPVIYAARKKVFNCELLKALHGESFSRTGLPISENCDSPCIKD